MIHVTMGGASGQQGVAMLTGRFTPASVDAGLPGGRPPDDWCGTEEWIEKNGCGDGENSSGDDESASGSDESASGGATETDGGADAGGRMLREATSHDLPLAKAPLRYGRDTAEIRPRYGRDTAEMRPRYGRDTAEVRLSTERAPFPRAGR